MDGEFAKAVASWHDFYALAGSAAASLVGLLFVAVSIHLPRVTAEESGPLLAFAAHTFSSFLYVLLVALFMMVPNQAPASLGYELMGLGAVTTIQQIRYSAKRFVAGADPVQGDQRGTMFKVVFPVLCYASMVWVGWSISSTRSPKPLAILISTVVLLLITGARNSWRLLIEVARARS